jgi:hypothetical protein
MMKSDLANSQKIIDLIHELTRDEGDGVEIHHDNPDFDGENCCITVTRRFTTTQNIYGESVLQCLENAKKARRP